MARELSGKLGESALVGGHAHSEGREVRELVRETNRATVDEDEVASLAANLIHLEDTLAGHGDLELVNEVLAKAKRPAHADLATLEAYSLTRPLILEREDVTL